MNYLLRENREIYNILDDLINQGLIWVHQLITPSLEDVFLALDRFRNRIAILHYIGVVAEDLQLLEADYTLDRRNFSQALAEEQNLRLVFLSGIATKKQVKTLLEAGIPTVLATSTTISDKMAFKFAIQFYISLAQGSNIQESFIIASGYVEVRNPKREIDVKLRLFREAIQDDSISNSPWGLYVMKREATYWTLSDIYSNKITIEDIKQLIEQDKLEVVFDNIHELPKKFHYKLNLLKKRLKEFEQQQTNKTISSEELLIKKAKINWILIKNLEKNEQEQKDIESFSEEVNQDDIIKKRLKNDDLEVAIQALLNISQSPNSNLHNLKKRLENIDFEWALDFITFEEYLDEREKICKILLEKLLT